MPEELRKSFDQHLDEIERVDSLITGWLTERAGAARVHAANHAAADGSAGPSTPEVP